MKIVSVSFTGETFEDGDVLEIHTLLLDIPGPGQHEASSGDTVVYSEQGRFYATISVRGEGDEAVMDVVLLKSDGITAWADTLRAPR